MPFIEQSNELYVSWDQLKMTLTPKLRPEA